MKIWNAISASDAGHELLSGFLKANPEAEICFDFKDLGEGTIRGNAGYPIDGIITININSNSESMGRPQLEVARTILHEMIHAELIRMIVEAGGYDDLQQFASTYEGDDPFMMIWNFYEQYGTFSDDPNNTGWQHEYMANYYIGFIADALTVLGPDLLSPQFQSYVSIVTPADLPWSWDDFYSYVAWGGLQKTEQFQTDIVNLGLEDVYDWLPRFK